MSTCSDPNCDKPTVAHGLCSSHYQKKRREQKDQNGKTRGKLGRVPRVPKEFSVRYDGRPQVNIRFEPEMFDWIKEQGEGEGGAAKWVRKQLEQIYEDRPIPQTTVKSEPAEAGSDILTTAAKCFIQKGFHNTTVKDICTQAGISTGTLYQHFKTKKIVIAKLCERQHQEILAMYDFVKDTDVAPPISALAQLDALIDAQEESLWKEGNARLYIEICSEAARNEQIGQTWLELDTLIRNKLTLLIRLGQESGELDASLDAELVTTVLFALSEGFHIRKSMFPLMELTTFAKSIKHLMHIWLQSPIQSVD